MTVETSLSNPSRFLQGTSIVRQRSDDWPARARLFPTEQLWCAPEVPEHLRPWRQSNHGGSRETLAVWLPRYSLSGVVGHLGGCDATLHGGSPSSAKNDEEASFLDGQNRSFRTHSDPASNFAATAKTTWLPVSACRAQVAHKLGSPPLADLERPPPQRIGETSHEVIDVLDDAESPHRHDAHRRAGVIW